ncbi:uncharacterized protein LOC135160228 isoform X2 [Diachasmimorpha longicaudata]|uniref:uncharacterized protein LOC135160228 isoform X2 n=1 Tax=Diachasmimorpha longicaudata TaxID=58733 RepID=UPI0030B87A81
MVGMLGYIKSSRVFTNSSYCRDIKTYTSPSGLLIKEYSSDNCFTFGLTCFERGIAQFARMKLIFSFVPFILIVLGVMVAMARGFPASDPEAAMENMRQIPQWHCLRYRKFDLVRRCRNYRLSRKH